jgi:transposase
LNGRILCPAIYDWTTDSAWFLEWFEWFLFPLLAVGSVIILDNAGFHKKAEVCRIAASYGCRAIFLPPYSPDKNKIEKSWANLKNWLRLNAKKYAEIQDAVSAYFKTE